MLAVTIFVVSFATSCKKVYHCQCSYNNKIMLVKDLGSQVESDAKDMCSDYDSTVVGEKWTCVVY